ncbi:hypothetical protein [Novipirellula artificiosorum]|nr:hypothetical protein [Novipirellula artificiosorum]
MLLTRILSLSLAALLVSAIAAPAQAFMIAGTENSQENRLDLKTMVSELAEFSSDESITCEQKIARIDQALTKLDAILDAGTMAEADVLATRDAILEIRRNLKCTEHHLAGCPDCLGGDVMASPMYDGGFAAPMMDGGFASGAGGFSGGAGGSGVGGGGARWGLIAAGAAAAIAIPLATSDNEEPGIPASPSM